jgi:hypothetical protein
VPFSDANWQKGPTQFLFFAIVLLLNGKILEDNEWVFVQPVLNSTLVHYYGNTGSGVFKGGIQNLKGFWLKINTPKGNFWILRIGVMASCQKLDKKKNQKDSDDFWHSKLTLNVKFWHFLTLPHYTNLQNSITSFGYITFW